MFWCLLIVGKESEKADYKVSMACPDISPRSASGTAIEPDLP